LFFSVIALAWVGVLASCEQFDVVEPIQYIKKTYGPVIVGERYDFAFTVASKDGSVLRDMAIEATYAGASGTALDSKCYWTVPTGAQGEGQERSVEMLSNVTANGSVINANIRGDLTVFDGGYTSYAITVRYSYVVPAEARGKNVRFTVKWTTQKGTSKEYSTETYDVSNMDIKKDIVLTDADNSTSIRYFSIANMEAYTQDEVNALSNSASIDFVYRYNPDNITTPGGSSVRLNNAIIAPSNNIYLNIEYVPASWTKNDTWIEIRKWDDMQLKGAVPNNYITDMDILTADIRGINHAEYNLANDFGTVMQTADGVYRAYVYVKRVNNPTGSMTIGVKRLKMK